MPIYQKVELGLRLDTTWASAQDRYAYDGIRGELRGPSGQVREVLIFYYEPLRYGAVDKQLVYGNYRVAAPAEEIWLPAQDDIPQHRWRMRFVLDEPGAWTLQLMRGPAGQRRAWGAAISLQAIDSDRPAPLSFAPGARYLRDARGKSTFLMGHNLSYYSNKTLPVPYRDVRPDGDPAYARSTHWQYESYLDQLSNYQGEQPGGNYCRIILTPWTFDLEVETAGDYDACQPRAFDLDHLVETAAARGVYLQLALYDYVYFNDHPDSARHYRYYYWANNPYHTQLSGVEEVVDFFTDPAAQALSRQKIRYLIARYGYAPQFFCLELFNEIDNFLSSNRRYYVRHQAAIDAWQVAMGAYIHELSDQVLVTTSAMNPNSVIPVWQSAASDFSNYHLYQGMKNTGYFTHYLTQRFLQAYDLPTTIGEYDLHMTSNTGRRCWVDNNGPDPTTFSVMHNALWFSSFSGSFSTAMIWYYWIFHAHWLKPGGYLYYVPLRAFMADEDLGGLRPVANACGRAFLPEFDVGQASQGCYPNSNNAASYEIRGVYTSNDANLQVFALAGEKRVIGWVHNKNHYWYDLRHMSTSNDVDPDGCDPFNWPEGAIGTDAGLDPYRYPLYRETMTLPVGRAGRYRLEWWHTYPAFDYSGDGHLQGGTGRIEAWTEQLQARGSSLTVTIPPLVALANAEGARAPDYGFKLIWVGE
jgi:hypothetical protein